MDCNFQPLRLYLVEQVAMWNQPQCVRIHYAFRLCNYRSEGIGYMKFQIAENDQRKGCYAAQDHPAKKKLSVLYTLRINHLINLVSIKTHLVNTMLDSSDFESAFFLS